jgi:hypothetical protein
MVEHPVISSSSDAMKSGNVATELAIMIIIG